MRISDWSSDVCSSDLVASLVVQGVETPVNVRTAGPNGRMLVVEGIGDIVLRNGLKIVCIKRTGRPPQIATFNQPVRTPPATQRAMDGQRSEEHTSELQSLMRSSYAVFCLKKKTQTRENHIRKPYTNALPHK